MLFAFMGLVWSRTDLFGHNDVILGSHMHALTPGITVSTPTGLGRPQNSDSACLLASGITRHHYLVVRVVWGWLVSPLGGMIGDNDVIVICMVWYGEMGLMYRCTAWTCDKFTKLDPVQGYL